MIWITRSHFLPAVVSLALFSVFSYKDAMASTVTYSFTGTVFDNSGVPSIAIGSTVTGTYMFDYSGGPSGPSGSNPIGSDPSVGWSDYLVGGPGTAAGGIAPSSFVFSSTLIAGGTAYYNTGPAQEYETQSAARGYRNQGQNAFSASEDTVSGLGGFAAQSGLNLYAPVNSAFVPYDSNGLPVLGTPATLQSAVGYVNYRNLSTSLTGYPLNNWSIQYDITSITPVPLPAAAWLLLGGLGAILGKRKLREHPSIAA